jgi:hypothetical protein
MKTLTLPRPLAVAFPVSFAVVVSFALLLSLSLLLVAEASYLPDRLDLHNQILSGSAPSPYLYRVLVPFAVEPVHRLLSHAMPQEIAFLSAYWLYNFFALALLLFALLHYVRLWYSERAALIAVALVGCSIPVTFSTFGYFQPWSLLEVGLFTLVLLLIYRQQYAPLVALVAIATLNRETAVFIPVAYFLANRSVRRTAALFAVWLAVYGGLRLALGDTPHVIGTVDLIIRNTRPDAIIKALMLAVSMLGPLAILAAVGYRNAPAFTRSVLPVALPYLASIVVFGVWWEVRLLMFLFPLLAPLALAAITRCHTSR